MHADHPSGVARAAYLALLAWQPVWLLILSPPLGPRSAWFAVPATVILLLPLKRILRLERRAMTWGAYLVLLYFLVGVTEAWSNPQQRIPALVQVVLSCSYLGASILAFRGHRG